MALPRVYQRSESTLFPGFSEKGVWERVTEKWNLVDYSFPIPKESLRCGTCWSYQRQLKDYTIHKSDAKTIPARCDVTLKCTGCSKVETFGVPIPEEMHTDLKNNAYGLRWDDALALMVRRGEISPRDIAPRVMDRIGTIILKNEGYEPL